MVDDLPDSVTNLVFAVLGGALVYGVHEAYHMVAEGLATAVVIDNIGSVALGLLAVGGYYAITEANEVEFENVLAGAAFIVTAGAHSAHHFLQPEFIGMGELMAVVGFVGALILAYAPELE